MSIRDLHTRLVELADAIPPSAEDPTQAVTRRVRRHQRYLWGGAVAVAVVVAATAGLLVTSRTTSSRRVTAGPTPGSGSATAQQLARFHWSQLPPAPVEPRDSASLAWTGHELVVWGGIVDDHAGGRPIGDGAAFNPTSNQWRRLASAANLEPRWNAVTLWTGTEVLVIGGAAGETGPARDGAYDPTADRWRVLPPRPSGLTGTLSGVWDGQEALVMSANRQAAAYNPVANQWRALPPLPELPTYEVAQIAPVWAGTRLLVWAEWSWVVSRGNETTGNSGIDLWSLDPSFGAWTKLGDGAAGPSGVSTGIWTGDEVLLPAAPGWRGAASGPGYALGDGPPGYRFNPSTSAYRPMTHGPVDDTSRDAVWTGGALVRTTTGSISPRPPQGTPTTVPPPGQPSPTIAAAWDAATDAWTMLPQAPPSGGDLQVIWTGREILSYGPDASFRFGP